MNHLKTKNLLNLFPLSVVQKSFIIAAIITFCCWLANGVIVPNANNSFQNNAENVCVERLEKVNDLTRSEWSTEMESTGNEQEKSGFLKRHSSFHILITMTNLDSTIEDTIQYSCVVNSDLKVESFEKVG